MAVDTRNEEKNKTVSQGDKVLNLFECLASYKSSMAHTSNDFSADKVKQYESVREAMARIYVDDLSFFGPEHVTPMEIVNEDDPAEKTRILKQPKEDKEMINRGYNRVQEKLKEIRPVKCKFHYIRQDFFKAVTSESRSGSGKIAFEFYNRLAQIWGGSPAA